MLVGPDIYHGQRFLIQRLAFSANKRGFRAKVSWPFWQYKTRQESVWVSLDIPSFEFPQLLASWHGMAWQRCFSTPTLRIYSLLSLNLTLSLSLSLSLSLNCNYKYRAPSSVFNQLNYNHHSSTYVVFDGCEAPCWRSRARAMLLALKCQ